MTVVSLMAVKCDKGGASVGGERPLVGVAPEVGKSVTGENVAGSVPSVLPGEAGSLLQRLMDVLPLLPHDRLDASGCMNGS